jgi:exodeoxyribonuclease VII small subunit
MSTKNKPLKDQLTELDELIAWFDQEEFDLDEALKKFDDGVALADLISRRLDLLENKITVLKQRFDQPE